MDLQSTPKELLYYTSQISNFTRNCVKVNSLNQTSLASDGVQQIRLALPVNSVLNLKSLTMYGEVTTEGVAASAAAGSQAVHALIPKGGIGALLERVTWAAGGVALDNGATPYYVIQALRDNLEKGYSKTQSDDRVLQQSEIEDKDSNANTSLGQTKHLMQNNFLGFTAAHPQYLDMSLLPECFCTIQCAPSYVLPVQQANLQLGEAITPAVNVTAAQGVKYKIANIFFTVEVCSIGSGMYDQLTQRLLQERGSIDVPYSQYQVFQSTSSETGMAQINGSISCMSLDRMYALARNNAGDTSYTRVQAPVKCENAVGCSFSQRATTFQCGSVATSAEAKQVTWQFQLNNAPMPMYRANALEAYNYAVINEDRSYASQAGSSVTSQKDWFQTKWVASQRLSFDNDPTRLSGTNLSSINAQIIFTPNDSTAVKEKLQMMLITRQSSVLRIGMSRACAVVA